MSPDTVAAPGDGAYLDVMARLAIELPHHRYDVLIEPDSLDRLGEAVRARAPHAECALFSDGAVADTLGARAQSALERAGYRVTVGRLEPGEQWKTLDAVRDLYDVLLGARLERRAPVIALGGGVTGDTVGLAGPISAAPPRPVPDDAWRWSTRASAARSASTFPEPRRRLPPAGRRRVDPLALTTLPTHELRRGLPSIKLVQSATRACSTSSSASMRRCSPAIRMRSPSSCSGTWPSRPRS
jgi:3-dehydroquinate synthase